MLLLTSIAWHQVRNPDREPNCLKAIGRSYSKTLLCCANLYVPFLPFLDPQLTLTWNKLLYHNPLWFFASSFLPLTPRSWQPCPSLYIIVTAALAISYTAAVCPSRRDVVRILTELFLSQMKRPVGVGQKICFLCKSNPLNLLLIFVFFIKRDQTCRGRKHFWIFVLSAKKTDSDAPDLNVWYLVFFTCGCPEDTFLYLAKRHSSTIFLRVGTSQICASSAYASTHTHTHTHHKVRITKPNTPAGSFHHLLHQGVMTSLHLPLIYLPCLICLRLLCLNHADCVLKCMNPWSEALLLCAASCSTLEEACWDSVDLQSAKPLGLMRDDLTDCVHRTWRMAHTVSSRASLSTPKTRLCMIVSALLSYPHQSLLQDKLRFWGRGSGASGGKRWGAQMGG